MSIEAEETLRNADGTSPAASDATGRSSAAKPKGEQQREESPPTQGAKKPGSIAEALDAAKLEQPAGEAAGDGREAGAEGTAEEPPPEEGAGSGEDESDGAGGPKDETAGKDKSAGSANDLFHKRPEWAELNKALGPDGAKKARPIIRQLMEREHRAVEQVTKLRPVVDELRQHTGDEQGFTTMRQIVKAYATDPAAAVPILKNMLADAEERAGFVVSSPDLKAKLKAIDQRVEQGLLDEEDAQVAREGIIEAEKARAGKKQADSRLQQAEQERRQSTSQARATQRANSINSWESNIRERDPDFGNVTDVDHPRHGESIADRVFDALQLKFMQNPDVDDDELLAEANRVYRLAKGQLSRGPLREQRAVTSHEASSVTAKPKPKNLREAMDQAKLVMPKD